MSCAANRFPGFKLVDKDVFCGWVMKTHRNVHPSILHSPPYNRTDGYVSTWGDLKTNEVVGYSTRHCYYLRENLLSEAAR